MKNKKNKTRKISNPYEIWKTEDGTWEWRVLKHYQSTENEEKNPEARVFCGVKSPYTYGEYELGDVWLSEIKRFAILTFEDKNLEDN